MLCEKQNHALLNPNSIAFAEVNEATTSWNHLASIEEKFFQQKSRITWLKNGDHNTSFFHRSVTTRVSKNGIRRLIKGNGEVITDPNDIRTEATEFFRGLLQNESINGNNEARADWTRLITYRCPSHIRSKLATTVTREEIKKTLLEMPSNKAPGPDGFTSEFFTACWPIVGEDFVTAIQSFFTYGHMPRGINATKLALIPKTEGAETIRDFRPISCCNVIYKVISKLIANRLKELLPEAIEKNQCAFVKGRLLLENVLLATELAKNYHRPHVSPRCMLKMDIAKAFDTLNWKFILATLHVMAIPAPFISWIQACIETASFSISINGEMEGFFNSNRGLRQGCPLSPYLFVIAMNVLSLSLTDASLAGKVGYHPSCKELHLNHLCFADDLMVFTDGKPASIREVLRTLENFGEISGLHINPSKSTAYAISSIHHSLNFLTHDMGIQMEQLPIRYLGLPLTTRSMTRNDYKPLITKIRSRFLSWSTRALSFAGRLQLIQSVVKSITNFWCSVFRLPSRCFKEIDCMCSAFLWSGSPYNTTKSKVSWEEVCSPKIEGGLGIRRMLDSSKMFSLHLIWRLLENSKSLWAAWTHTYLLRKSSFWDAKKTTRGSWIWNKLLKLIPLAKDFIQCKVNSGTSTMFWLDNWTGNGRLIETTGEGGTRHLGIHRDAPVSEVTTPNGWFFRRCRIPQLRDIINDIMNRPPPKPDAGKDLLLWKHDLNDFKPWFSSKRTWQQIRAHKPFVPWYKIVWFRHNIPRQAFITWLAVKDRLATGARTSTWGHQQACILCGERNETRDHLFFACPFTFTLWTSLCNRLLPVMDPDWQETLNTLSRNRMSTNDQLISLMLFQGSVYHLWRERNHRIHNGKKTTIDSLTRKIRLEISNRILNISEDDTNALRTRWQNISEV